MNNVISKWVKNWGSENSEHFRCIDFSGEDSVLGSDVSERWNRLTIDNFTVYDHINVNVSAESNWITIDSKRPADSKGKSIHYTLTESSYRPVCFSFSWLDYRSEDKLKSSFTVGGLHIPISARIVENAPSSIAETLD